MVGSLRSSLKTIAQITGDCATSSLRNGYCAARRTWRRQSAVGPLPRDVYGSKADAIGGGAAEVRLAVAPCQQLRYGLTEGGTVAVDAPDPFLPECLGRSGTPCAASPSGGLLDQCRTQNSIGNPIHRVRIVQLLMLIHEMKHPRRPDAKRRAEIAHALRVV